MSNEKSNVNFVACLTSLLKDIVLAIEENSEILSGLYVMRMV
jgi:conserved oligomeric Golgi complex subunit 4